MKTNCTNCGSQNGTCNDMIDSVPIWKFEGSIQLTQKAKVELLSFTREKEAECSIQVLSSYCAKLYAETRGAYFMLTPKNDGSGWILKIPGVGETFEGQLVFVLFKYVCYVKDNREQYPGKKNSIKPFRL